MSIKNSGLNRQWASRALPKPYLQSDADKCSMELVLADPKNNQPPPSLRANARSSSTRSTASWTATGRTWQALDKEMQDDTAA